MMVISEDERCLFLKMKPKVADRTEMDLEEQPTTPTSEEFRIGRRVHNYLTCPPPPRKPKSLPGPITMSRTTLLHNNNNVAKYFTTYSELHAAFFASTSSFPST
ncbi:hypothetical protein E6C27_scaffold501G002020 [Cucumis melo var. makuwa]|uniref:Uncharacterized protein n=2 Tax=Cucumis melo TaxID=3656 RepID=A0A5A7V162_CUCMM|nr:hypothetical protein E6C27_scaffold501G002020 [Cucumis melo var. makuwa]